MFNKEFYPTPKWLVNEMIKDIDFNKVKFVLEPSAGKGDIIDNIVDKIENTYKYYHRKELDIDAIEIDDNLSALLRGKKYKVIFNDFLYFNTYKKYDLIIMNPPFSVGDKHLLKAIDMQKDGGAIICILNAETIRNPYSNTRKDLIRKLTELNAKIEFLDNAFVYAENETNVEIALIKIYIPEPKSSSFILQNLKQEESFKDSENPIYEDLIINDFVKQIVDRYNLELKAGIKLLEEYKAMKPFILKSIEGEYRTEEPMLKIVLNHYDANNEITINDFVVAIRQKYWRALFKNKEFIGKLTNNLQNEFYNKVTELKNYDFSPYNIYTLRGEMQNYISKGIEETIINLFEELSNQYHWYDETSQNIHYYNGWKTNKAWIINKKVIIPLNAFNSWDKRIDYNYSILNKLTDIEKVFKYLDGDKTNNNEIENRLAAAKAIGQTKKIHLKFFDVTFYKRGTCHIEFTKLELLKKFNIFGSQKKNWLPPTYGKVKYKDMTDEEKKVIDEFEGEESYNKTIENVNYFIVKSNELVQLSA